MPQKIAELPKLVRGREKKYNLSEYVDGAAYLFVQGTADQVEAKDADFDCEVTSMRANLYRAAKDAGLKPVTRVKTLDDGREAIAFQAVANSDKSKSDKAPKSEPKAQAAKPSSK